MTWRRAVHGGQDEDRGVWERGRVLGVLSKIQS